MLLAARRLESGRRRLEKASGNHRRAMAAAAASSSFSMSSLESNPLECKICYNLYSEDHCPRILPCSHEFCGRCIKGLISTQMKFCTVCHEEFAANSAEDLMISRGLLDAAKQLSSPHIRQNLTKTKNPKKVFLKTKRFRKNITKGCIDVCQGAEAEVKGLIESSRKLRRAVVVVKLGSSKTLENIDLHIQLLENKLATIQRNTLSIKASYSQLKAATDFTSTNVLMKETTEFLQAIEETVTKFQKDKKEQYHIKKEMLRMKGELENSVTDPEEQQNEERDSVVNITVNDLRSIHGLLRGNAERKTFAVMTFHGKQRVGPVKIESGNKIRVSRVEEGVVPPRSFVIQLESLMQGSCSIRRVFLDLACGSIHLGSVIIKITDNCSTMALNFIHMCLGDMGPSYCHSGLRAKWKGESETIALGSYDVPHGGGTSTQAVFSREDFEQERQRTHECTVWRAGQVRGNFSFESASKVWIITKDDPHKKGKTLFGKVEEGLDILQNALSWYPDKKVKITNCGLVLDIM